MDNKYSSDVPGAVYNPPPPPSEKERKEMARRRAELERRAAEMEQKEKVWSNRPLSVDLACFLSPEGLHKYELESYGEYSDYSEWLECVYCEHALDWERIILILELAMHTAAVDAGCDDF